MDISVTEQPERYRVTVLLNPFTEDSVWADVPVTVPLNNLVPEKIRNDVRVLLDGELYDFSDTEPVRGGSIVSIRVIPQDNDAARIIGSLIVIVLAWYLGPVIAGAMGFEGAFAASIVSAVIATAGMLVLNTLIPMEIPTFDGPSGKSLNTIAPTRNRLEPYSSVSMVFGRIRMYPPYCAMPYTEMIGSDQYLNGLFALGHGEYQRFDNVRIGDTLVEDYEGFTMGIAYGPDMSFPSINEDPFNIELEQLIDTGTSSYTRRSAASASALSIDLVFPRGLIYTSTHGADRNSDIRVFFSVSITRVSDNATFQVRATDDVVGYTNDWENETWGDNNVTVHEVVSGHPLKWHYSIVPRDGSIFSNPDYNPELFCLRGFSFDPIRRTLKFKTPTVDQYDVTVTRVYTRLHGNATLYSAQEGDEVWNKFVQESRWTTLRTYIVEPTVPNGLTQGDDRLVYSALRVKATDQLSGALDQFNMLVERRYWYHNGTTWVLDGGWTPPVNPDDDPTEIPLQYPRSPAWAAVEVLCGDMNIAKIDRDTGIDIPAFTAWANWCRTNEFYYDDEISDSMSVWDLLKRIGAVGRAEIIPRDGVYTVIMDNSQSDPVQVFTPRNYKNFSGSRVFLEPVHAIRAQYRSETEDYNQTERFVYMDGYDESNSSIFEVVQFPGITNDEQVWREGRRYLGILIHRNEFFTIDVDVENIVSLRGDTALLQTDSALIGVMAARITSVSSGGGSHVIGIDAGVDLELGTTYSMQLRTRVSDDVFIQTRQITLPLSGSGISSLTVNAFSVTPQVGDLVAIGVLAAESMRVKVLAVDPLSDLAARITFTTEGAAIYTADTGPIPPYDPLITQPPDYTKVAPSKPRIIAVRSEGWSSIIQPGGSIQLRMQVTFQVDSVANYAGIEVSARYREIVVGDETNRYGDWRYTDWKRDTEGVLWIDQIQDGITYEVQVIARTVPTLIASPWSDSVYHTVGQPTHAPPTITDLVIEPNLGGVQVIVDLTTVDIIDAGYIEVQYHFEDVRDDPAALYFRHRIPVLTTTLDDIDFFLPLPDGAIRYFWARLVSVFNVPGPWFPADVPTSDVRITPDGDRRITPDGDVRIVDGAGSSSPGVMGYAQTGTSYYILPTRGTAIRNSVGTLSVEAHRVGASGDVHLSDGTIRMYLEDGITLAGDGFTWDPISASDISFSDTIYLRDGPGGPIYDTITLADITDGVDGADGSPGAPGAPGADGTGAAGFFSRYDKLVWRRDRDLGAWAPDTNPIFVDINFYQNGTPVARDAVRLEVNTTSGLITAYAEAHSDGDLDTASITLIINGNTNPELPFTAGTTCTITALRTIDGNVITATETFYSIEGGLNGFPTTGMLYDPEFEREILVGNNFHWKVREGSGISFTATGGADNGACAVFTGNSGANTIVSMNARGNTAAHERVLSAAPGQRIYYAIRFRSYLARSGGVSHTTSWEVSNHFTVQAECINSSGGLTTDPRKHGQVGISQHTTPVGSFITLYGWLDLDTDINLVGFKLLLGTRANLTGGNVYVDMIQVYTAPPASWGLDSGNMFPMSQWTSSAGAVLTRFSRQQLELMNDNLYGDQTLIGPGEAGYPVTGRPDPFFENSDVILRCACTAENTLGGGSSVSNGGVSTSAQVWQVDSRKSYRVSAFIRLTGQQRNPVAGRTAPALYLGWRGRGQASNSPILTDKSGGSIDDTHAFPATTVVDKLRPGQWYFLSMIVHPYGATWTDDQSGLFDPVTGQRVIAGRDFRFADVAVSHLGIVLQIYNMIAIGDEFMIRRPRFENVDGAPDIFQLMGVSPQRAADNLVNTLGWPAVQTTITADRAFKDGWSVYSPSSQFSFERVTGPLGEQVVAARITRNGTTSGNQGMLKLHRAVDPDKSYMVGIWVRRSFTTAGLYIGYGGSGPAGTDDPYDNVETIAGAAADNPYAVAAASLPVADRWYLFYTIVRNHQNSSSASDGISGIYDPTTGTNILAASQFRFVDADSCFLNLRFFDYATTGLAAGQSTYFAHPMYYQVDDDFPQIDTLLQRARSWGTISAGKFVSENGAGDRLEIEAGHQFPIWAGSGTKNEANATLYYDRTNNIFKVRDGTIEGGTVIAGTLQVAYIEPDDTSPMGIVTQRTGGVPTKLAPIYGGVLNSTNDEVLLTTSQAVLHNPWAFVTGPTYASGLKMSSRLSHIGQNFMFRYEALITNTSGVDRDVIFKFEYRYDGGSWQNMPSGGSVSLTSGETDPYTVQQNGSRMFYFDHLMRSDDAGWTDTLDIRVSARASAASVVWIVGARQETVIANLDPDPSGGLLLPV